MKPGSGDITLAIIGWYLVACLYAIFIGALVGLFL